ncbi:hypothetical protein P308_08145 [Pseudomonas piscis]|nr:hypothetical protein P308_08145 [Pseudomonas piscis]
MAALALDLEVELARKAEYQLRMLVAVGDQVVAVVAQGEDRSIAVSLAGPQSTPAVGPFALSSLCRISVMGH